ncbi:hypothetical protein FRC12_016433 [Ceratobasidium sp. 428]|nr:hypothetical protein FRC12_016433 [Ceratobasidium sp. 428]
MAHAKRVDNHQLGMADLIVQDIEGTMTSVWNSMPLGFGNAVGSHPERESKKHQPMYEIITPSSSFKLPVLNVGTPPGA